MLSLIKHPEKNELSLQEQFKQNERKIHMAENQFKYLRKLRLVTPRTSPILKELLDKRNTLKGPLEEEEQSPSLQRSASCPPFVENTNSNPQANESESKRPMSALSICLKASENAAANLPKTQTALVANKTNALNGIERLGKSLSTHAETAPPGSSVSHYSRFSGVANTFFGRPSFLEKVIKSAFNFLISPNKKTINNIKIKS